MVRPAAFTTILKLAEDVALAASVTVAVIPYVPGRVLEETDTTPVLASTVIPLTCELSEVLLMA
jgi:hypothetical protein